MKIHSVFIIFLFIFPYFVIYYLYQRFYKRFFVLNSAKITSVLLGADLNSYSVARAFSEYCGAVSYAFGKYPLGTTNHSDIVNFAVEEGLSDDSVTVSLLVSFAEAHSGEELYLFGCTDEYAEMIIRNRAALSEYYFCPCVTADMAEALGTKESFYSMCEKYGIPYPKTFLLRPDDKADSLSEEILGFSYPVIIKPSHSSSYWKHPFDGMKKVYCAKNEDEAKAIAGKIFGAGYEESLIIQDMIPGGDDRMYVLTCYSGTDGKTKKACLGHVLLEEHTPKGLGNHTAVITENHPEITELLIKFLDEIGYMGFSNFDIKYDSRDGKFKVFEVNLRQGRSNYYVTSAGQNIAKTVIDDRRGLLSGDCEICHSEVFWHTVPKPIIYKYTGKDMAKKLKSLVRSGKSFSSLWYRKDLKNPKRLFFVAVHNFRYYGKYRKNGDI